MDGYPVDVERDLWEIVSHFHSKPLLPYHLSVLSVPLSSFVSPFLTDGTVCTRVIIVVQVLLGGGLHRMLKGAYNSGKYVRRCLSGLITVCACMCSCTCVRATPPSMQAYWNLNFVPAFSTFQSSLRSSLKWLGFKPESWCSVLIYNLVQSLFN